MEGFYSNFLTKNIAAGADVEEYATSAYTTGGKRIDNALAVDKNEGSDDIVKGDRRDNEKRSEKRNRSQSDIREMNSKREKRDDHDISTVAGTCSSDSAEKITAPSFSVKEVKITSARERYLARKQQQNDQE